MMRERCSSWGRRLISRQIGIGSLAAWSIACLATSFLWPSACVTTEQGSRWEWNLAVAGAVPSAAGAAGNPARSVELERALFVVVSLEAIPCSPSETSSAARVLAPLGVARAHGVPTPTRMAMHHVIDLLETRPSWAVSVSHPPPDIYCWVRVTIGPADRDAIGLPADESLTDTALTIRGRHGDVDAPPTQPFEVTSTRTQSIDVPLRDANGSEAPLVVSDVARNVAVDVWLEGPDVLAGLDLSAGSTQGGLFAITNLLASFRAAGCPQAPCGTR